MGGGGGEARPSPSTVASTARGAAIRVGISSASAAVATRDNASASAARRGAPATVVVTRSPQPPIVVPLSLLLARQSSPSGLVRWYRAPLTRWVPAGAGTGDVFHPTISAGPKGEVGERGQGHFGPTHP